MAAPLLEGKIKRARTSKYGLGKIKCKTEGEGEVRLTQRQPKMVEGAEPDTETRHAFAKLTTGTTKELRLAPLGQARWASPSSPRGTP